MDSISQSILDTIFNLSQTFINIIMSPINQALDPVLSGILASEQIVNFYYVINNYVLPGVSYFINIIPPYTWSALLVFITFYIGLYSVVMAVHLVLKVLRVIKRLVPFM